VYTLPHTVKTASSGEQGFPFVRNAHPRSKLAATTNTNRRNTLDVIHRPETSVHALRPLVRSQIAEARRVCRVTAIDSPVCIAYISARVISSRAPCSGPSHAAASAAG
jgi:hypothetical protein